MAVTVNGKLVETDSTPIPSRKLRIDLATGGSGGFLTSGAQVIASTWVTTAADGSWHVSLDPNITINPTGTYYLVSVGLDVPLAFVVPDSDVPVNFEDCLVDNPASPGMVVTGIAAVVPGEGLSVDDSDPSRPVVSLSTPIDLGGPTDTDGA